MFGPGGHVLNRFAHSYREASSPRLPPHEANSVAFEKKLESTRIPREGNPNSKVLAPTFTIVAGRKERTQRPTITPNKACSANFTDPSKEGRGAHLNEHTARGTLLLPESKLHINYLELKAVFLALKEFQSLCSNSIVLIATDNTTVVSYINKEGGMRSGTLCPAVENPDLVYQKPGYPQSPTHSRLAECGSRQAIKARPDHPEWSLLPEVFQAICSRWHRPPIDLFATKFNNKLPQFVSPVPDPMDTAVDALCHGRVWTLMPSHQQHIGQSGGEVTTPHARESFWFHRGGPTCPGSGIW